MSKKKKLESLNEDISRKILDVLAILDILSETEQSSYPTNTMIDMAKRKAVRLFKNIEKTRKIL